MEAIRGSGAIAGTARAAYVMWPPADGGGKSAKFSASDTKKEKLHSASWRRNTATPDATAQCFVRDARGILQDRTQQYLVCFLAPTTARRCAPIC
jgi:hypothetical protein